MSKKLGKEGEPEFFNNDIRFSLEEKKFPKKYYPGLEQENESNIHKPLNLYGARLETKGPTLPSENPVVLSGELFTQKNNLEADFKKQLEEFRMKRQLAELSLRVSLTPLVKSAIDGGLTGPDIHKVVDELIARRYGSIKSEDNPLK